MPNNRIDRAEAIRKLGELIKGIQIAMLTTVTADGRLRSRPMATQNRAFDGDLWFFTGRWSGKTYELDKDQRVNVSYAAPSKNTYVSVSGSARTVVDKAKARELWTPVHRAWFPDGLDDPDLALVRVTVEDAEYWDAPSSTMVKLFGMAKALLTGESYNPAEHERVRLTPADRDGRRTKRRLKPAHSRKLLEQNRAGRARQKRRTNSAASRTKRA
jgi:general stress protein 26